LKNTEVVKVAIQQSQGLYQKYLDDLTDAELFARPVPGSNHIAWQLGHLIRGEHRMISACCPGSMPPLPEGFAEKHTNDTAAIDDPAAFYTKAQYLETAAQQRQATLAALEKLSDADLAAPAPESLQRIAPTVLGIFVMQGTHWTMHAGQWAITRRKLGRKPLF
jgi:DinB superfamily